VPVPWSTDKAEEATHTLTQSEVKILFDAIDTDSDGKVSPSEFHDFMVHKGLYGSVEAEHHALQRRPVRKQSPAAYARPWARREHPTRPTPATKPRPVTGTEPASSKAVSVNMPDLPASPSTSFSASAPEASNLIGVKGMARPPRILVGTSRDQNSLLTPKSISLSDTAGAKDPAQLGQTRAEQSDGLVEYLRDLQDLLSAGTTFALPPCLLPLATSCVRSYCRYSHYGVGDVINMQV
jgi:hypothetical protein